MPVVTFHPSARSFDVLEGSSLLRAARRAKVAIASSCRGTGACKACRVQILAGAEHLSPLTEKERRAIVELAFANDERLACMARVHGPVTITTSYW